MSKGGYNKLLKKYRESLATIQEIKNDLQEKDAQLAASTGAHQENENLEDTSDADSSTAIKWLRGIGASSILLGGLGLMQTFFWPSVIAIYTGIAILVIDLALERFGPRWWAKIPIVIVVLLFAFGFTKLIVLRKNPLFVAHGIVDGRLWIQIQNASDDDYQDLDLKIKPDFPSDYVSDPKQVTSVPSVSFMDPVPFISNQNGESIEFQVDTTKKVGMMPMSAYKTNFLRFRCERLPSHTGITVSMLLWKLDKNDKDKEIPTFAVTSVILQGDFKGRFRTYKVNEDSGAIPLMQPYD